MMLTANFAWHEPVVKQAVKSKSFTPSSFNMKTKITLLAAIFGWAVTSHAHDPATTHADEDAHHAAHDRAAAHAASDHAQESYDHAVHSASHGDFFHAVRDFAHAAQDAHAAQHARDHAHAASDHADEGRTSHHHHD